MYNKLYIMIGLPGAGKTTIAKQNFKDIATILSSDDYRLHLTGDENDQSVNSQVFEELYRDAKTHLTAGKNVLIDATNITYKARKRAIQVGRECHSYIVGVFVYTPVSECIENDAKRSRKVGKGVIEKYLKIFEYPQKFEGFNEVLFIENRQKPLTYPRQKIDEIWQKCNEMQQNNPHHAYTVGEHMRRTAHLADLLAPGAVAVAALHHDIGKCLTYTEKDGVGHFYGHAGAGAYLFCEFRSAYTERVFDQAIFLINNHMRAHTWNTERTIVKYVERYGADNVRNLLLLAAIDKITTGVVSSNN